jgi:hypothetical protein
VEIGCCQNRRRFGPSQRARTARRSCCHRARFCSLRAFSWRFIYTSVRPVPVSVVPI